MSKEFYPSAIEYQVLEDNIMETDMDINPYHPGYVKVEPYIPHYAFCSSLDFKDYWNTITSGLIVPEVIDRQK